VVGFLGSSVLGAVGLRASASGVLGALLLPLLMMIMISIAPIRMRAISMIRITSQLLESLISAIAYTEK